MDTPYLGILVLLGLAATLCGGMVTMSWILGPKKMTPYKASPYECGVAPSGDARERFPVKFYLVAIMFILFDIEAVLLWPWATALKGSDTGFKVFSFVSFLTYMATWILGYMYMLRVNAIDWDESTSLASEKLVSRMDDDGPADPEKAPALEHTPIGVTAGLAAPGSARHAGAGQ